MPGVSKFLELLDLSVLKLFWVFLFTSLLFGLPMVLPDSALETLGLTEILDEYRSYFGVALLFAFVGLVVTGAGTLARWVDLKVRQRRTLKGWQRRLHDLTPAEKGILDRYIGGHTRTLNLDIGDGVVQGLVGVSVLYRASNVARLTTVAYNIQPWAWDYLREHPELLE